MSPGARARSHLGWERKRRARAAGRPPPRKPGGAVGPALCLAAAGGRSGEEGGRNRGLKPLL